METHVEVTGAYGRWYPTLKSAKEDWGAGKDFRLTTGPYIGKGEAERYNLGVVVRYGIDDEKVGTLRKRSR